MNPSLKEILETLSSLNRPHQNTPYPAEVKSLVAAYAREQLSCGATFQSVARDVGLCMATVRSWLSLSGVTNRQAAVSHETERIFLPVKVLSSTGADEGLVLVTPGGYRIEGLGLNSAFEFLARLP